MILQRTLTLPLARRTGMAFVAAIVVVAAGVTAAALKVAYAESLARSGMVSLVTRAAQLDPRNDSIQNRLGTTELWGGGDFEQAAQQYRRALKLNPNKADYWADLAEACQLAGHPACAEASLGHAIQLAPMRPEFYWQLANHYILTGEGEKAYSSFARLLSIRPEDAESALDVCLRVYGDADSIWRTVVIPSGQTSVQLDMLDLLAHRNQVDTGRYWEETRGGDVDFSLVSPYLDTLIAKGHYDLAARVWSDLQRTGVVPRDGRNPVYNGDFRNEPLNAGFDWRLVPQPFVESSVDEGWKEKGGRSLRIEYTMPNNADVEPAYEIVPISAGVEHVLRAWVKSEGITSQSGPELRVTDEERPTRLDVSSVPITGTTEWHEIELPFTAMAGTKVVRISLHRSRSREFPTEISGSLWVTAVSLDSNQ